MRNRTAVAPSSSAPFRATAESDKTQPLASYVKCLLLALGSSISHGPSRGLLHLPTAQSHYASAWAAYRIGLLDAPLGPVNAYSHYLPSPPASSAPIVNWHGDGWVFPLLGNDELYCH